MVNPASGTSAAQTTAQIVDGVLVHFATSAVCTIPCPECGHSHSFTPPKGRFTAALRTLPCTGLLVIVRTHETGGGTL